MIRRALNFLLLTLAFCCAMRHWQYYLGVRVVVADALLALFAALYATLVIARGSIPRLPSSLGLLAGGLWVLYAAQCLTGFALDPEFAPLAYTQFAKGVVNCGLYAVGFTAIIFHLGESPPAFARRTLQVFILGAVASSVFSFAELLCAVRGIDLPKATFASISTYGPDFDPRAPFNYAWDNFYRASGFPGVNAQATYTASVIPLLLIASPFSRRWLSIAFAIVCFAGMMLTLSRNGLATLALATLTLALLQPRRTFKLAGLLVLLALPVLALFFAFRGSAARLVATRTYNSVEQFASGRKEIYRAVWPTIVAAPLGHGLNQFSVHMLHSDDIFMGEIAAMYPLKDEAWVRNAYANVHNNWLNWLYEGGWPLLAAFATYYALVLWLCVRRGTPLAQAAFATLMALLISGFFNMTLDTFNVQLLFTLLPCAVIVAAPPVRRPQDQPVPAAPLARSAQPC